MSASLEVENTVQSAAAGYIRRGWAVVPIPRGRKAPQIRDWPNLQLTEDKVPAQFQNCGNIGVILGAASHGLIDVDLDTPEAALIADFFLPRTDFIFGHSSKPRSHRFYVSDAPPTAEKFNTLDGKTIVELRSTGLQTLVPPSLHPSGELYEFVAEGEPTRIAGRDIARRVRLIAAAALLARHWPNEGQRNDAANALAGMLLRSGWNEQEGAHFVEAVARGAGDEEIRQRMRDVRSTAERLVSNNMATGTPRLVQIIGNDAVRRVREWLDLDSDIDFISRTPDQIIQSGWPEPLAPEAFQGLAGEIVHVIEPHSEADPAALLIQLLVAFGNVIGRGPSYRVERHNHYTNFFALVVGATAKGRKGTSWSQIADLFERIESAWISTRIHGGTGSGEGLIWQVRDAVLKGEKLFDEGVQDKRMLILESEFAQVLAVVKREGNTTSEVLRRGWDGTPLQTMTKNSPARATGAHISVVGHITKDELLRHLDQTEIANGLINRFALFCARRSKALPDGGNLREAEVKAHAGRLQEAIQFAREPLEMKRDEDAAMLWRTVYERLSEGRPGLFGAVVSRSEAQVLRLSMIYALLDKSAHIRKEHLQAALAAWRYAEASARYIFGEAVGDPMADEILRALRTNPSGLTRREIRDLFGRNKQESQIHRAIDVLLSFGLIETRNEMTGGRPAQRVIARM